MAAEDGDVSKAVQALWSLRDSVGNFVLFEREVEDTLTSIFEKHQTDQNVFTQVRLSRIQVGPVIEEEITIWLKSMQRCLQARDPWTIIFMWDMSQRIFQFFMEVVRKPPSSYGVSCTETRLTDTIFYTKQNRLLRDWDCVILQKNQSRFIFPKESKCQGKMRKLQWVQISLLLYPISTGNNRLCWNATTVSPMNMGTHLKVNRTMHEVTHGCADGTNLDIILSRFC